MAKKKVYDGRLLFETWCSWGAAATNNRLMEFSYATWGKRSQMGARYAMHRWAFEHPEEAYPLYKEYWFDTHPEEGELKWEQFLEIVRRWAEVSSVGGTKNSRKLERFCAKYNLPMDFHINPGDVVQVVRRTHSLYQSMWIVDKVEGRDIHAFTVNVDGISVEEKFDVRQVGVVAKAIQPTKRTMTIKNMTLIPRLEAVAEENGQHLVNIDFKAKDGIEEGYRFWYAVKRDGEWKKDSYFYPDFDTGVESEIDRLRTLLLQDEAVVV